jgi:hypothetical protein
METFSQLLDTLARRITTWTALSAAHSGDALSKQLQSAPALFSAATALAADVAQPDSDRVIAAGLLARESSTQAAAIQTLGDWLTPKTPGSIQRSAVKALGLGVGQVATVVPRPAEVSDG